MGAGIAQLAIEAGLDTVGHELETGRAEAARDRIAHFLTRKVEKGLLGAAARDAALGRLGLTTELAGLADCDVVIEAAGPCTLIDLVGIDVHVHAGEALYEKLREPRMAPLPRLVRMLAARKLGRKSGEGFYRY